MLTLHQLARKTNSLRIEGSRYVKFTDLKKGYLTNGHGYIAGSSYSTHIVGQDGKVKVNDHPSKYVTVIEFLDTKLHVKVGCSCPDFWARHEYALWNKGAADIEYSNGEYPEITNPTLKVSTCKHLFALYKKIQSKLPVAK